MWAAALESAGSGPVRGRAVILFIKVPELVQYRIELYKLDKTAAHFKDTLAKQ